MTRQHAIVMTGRDLAAFGVVAAFFVAGAALLGWAVGRG